ncbi:MAG: archaemetzincin family Zn-dependent metalloprotease [Bryobacterales bacterium]|nr:archaemetzincin family Zn-dependent metalloprotease [Bryobacterales bacterium]
MTKPISLVRAGEGVDSDVLQRLAGALEGALRVPCRVESGIVEVADLYDPDRRQLRADLLLKKLADGADVGETRRLGVTAQDLYLPVLTHVFGAGQLTGNCAVVSLYRLREEAYGLPHSQPLLEERLLKEALHELGHTAGLRHCSVWQCVMSCSNGVELVDLKAARYCPHCHSTMQRVLQGHSAVGQVHPGQMNS